MIKLDWSDYNPDQTFKPVDAGVYIAEIEGCNEKVSPSSNDRYLNVRLRDEKTKRFLCFDVIMLTGKGKDIGFTKLTQLGINDTGGELTAASLVGKRVYVYLKHEPYNGKVRAKVDIRKFKCGYFNEEAGRDSKVETKTAGNTGKNGFAPAKG